MSANNKSSPSVINVKQDFLEHVYQELESNPDFKGQL